MIIIPVMRSEADHLVITGLWDGLEGFHTSDVILEVFPGVGSSSAADLDALFIHIEQMTTVHVSPL